MTARKQYPTVECHLYRGVPFRPTFLYQTPSGAGVDMAGKDIMVQFRTDTDLTLPIVKEVSVTLGTITLAFGRFTMDCFTGTETALLTEKTLLGTVLINEGADGWKTLFNMIVRLQDSTTEVL